MEYYLIECFFYSLFLKKWLMKLREETLMPIKCRILGKLWPNIYYKLWVLTTWNIYTDLKKNEKQIGNRSKSMILHTPFPNYCGWGKMGPFL